MEQGAFHAHTRVLWTGVDDRRSRDTRPTNLFNSIQNLDSSFFFFFFFFKFTTVLAPVGRRDLSEFKYDAITGDWRHKRRRRRRRKTSSLLKIRKNLLASLSAAKRNKSIKRRRRRNGSVILSIVR